jgi:hypothetical protein
MLWLSSKIDTHWVAEIGPYYDSIKDTTSGRENHEMTGLICLHPEVDRMAEELQESVRKGGRKT